MLNNFALSTGSVSGSGNALMEIASVSKSYVRQIVHLVPHFHSIVQPPSTSLVIHWENESY